MRDGELLYFTPAEFILMMELSGSGRYSLLQPPDPEPDDCAFLEAFSSLFRRGMLLREGENFRPGGRGSFFSGLRGAPWVVFLSSETELYGAACYVGDGVLWLVELADDLLARRYRVQQLTPRKLARQLLDAGVLEPPLLHREDAQELETRLEDLLSEPSGPVTLRLERYENGGGLKGAYTVRAGPGGGLLVRDSGTDRSVELYTAEALSQVLEECFGEGNL